LAPGTLEALSPDFIFFAGEWSNALILVRQVKLLYQHQGKEAPPILLSDWSADSLLTETGGSDLEGVYVSHPRRAAEIQNPDIGYKNYGRDAEKIIEKLVHDANAILSGKMNVGLATRRLLNMHRVSDARAALLQAMADPPEFSDMPSGETYKFAVKPDGKLENGRFKIWKIQNGKFTDCR
jgi:branched-chain amino acid transport system substrate-binding protein